MVTVYRKTAKGADEVESRSHRLPLRLRSTLILVDGKRSDTALQALVGAHAGETLQALAAQGFIEVISVADTRRNAGPERRR